MAPVSPSLLKRIIHIVDHPRHNLSLWGIAWTSFFWSTSSLMMVSILPIFLVEVLGASKTNLGVIEGVAVFMSFCSKVFSGVLSDYIKNRKPLILIGSLGSVLIKPIFAFASTVGCVFLARFLDRLSKGIRSAPTDALIADLSPKERRGASYGTRQSLYTFGGMFGALLGVILIWKTKHDYRLIFLLSMIPGVIAFVILALLVKQPPILESGKKVKWQFQDAMQLPPRYWCLLILIFFFMMARFSETFLTLRAKEVGWSLMYLPLIHVLMDLVHASVAMPMGRIADRLDRYTLLAAGLVLTTIAQGVITLNGYPFLVIVGVIITGIYLGIMQGLVPTLISECTPAHLRGTAFAMYYLVAGLAVLIGNIMAGYLSDAFGMQGAFVGGVVVTIVALLGLFSMRHVFKRGA